MSLFGIINTGLDWLQGGGIQKAAQTANTLMQNASASNTTNPDQPKDEWIKTEDGSWYNAKIDDFKWESPDGGFQTWKPTPSPPAYVDPGFNAPLPTAPTGLLPTDPTPAGPDPVGPTQPVAPPPPAAPQPTQSTQPQGNSDLIDIFQPDKYPSSWSGLPPATRDNLLDKILPRLFESVDNYEGNIDKSTKAAQELFQSQTRGGMKDTLQGILNSLAGRNMLNSTVASESIGQGMSDIIRAGADKGYETSMNNAGLKAQLPALLANITQLGQGSFNSNPLAPYELLAQYDWNMD